MVERNYDKLCIEEFGKKLLDSGDLDPVYIALYDLHRLGTFNDSQLCRWLLAYILCYHVGAACWLSEKTGHDFFHFLRLAAENTLPAPTGGRWPRSHERRHWRGQFAIDVVNKLDARFGNCPEDFILSLVDRDELTTSKPELISFHEFSMRVKAHHGFGSWATFKLADLVDRLGINPIDFSYEDVVIYKDPVEAAERLFRERNGLAPNATLKSHAVKGVFLYLIGYFDHYSAPPLYDRPVGVQEIETILCKWKSHQNGRYPLLNDILEIKEGLQPWLEHSTSAQAFNMVMPQIIEENSNEQE